MKSEVEVLAGLSRRLRVEVPREIVEAELARAYREVQKEAKFQGFRPGKAPMHMVKAEYQSRIEKDVATRIIQDHYGKAIDEHSLNPVNYPEIEFEGFREGESLKFSAVFEVRPDVALKKYAGLEVAREIVNVDDKIIDGILEDLRKSKASIVPVFEDRAAALGDVAVIDFHGTIGGTDLKDGSAKEHMLELGSGQFIPGFEEGIVGMKPGDKRDIALTFPADYQNKEVAGKPVSFAVVLKEIKKKSLPALDDEFAKTIGSHETLVQLREEIKKDVLAREQKRVRDDMRNRLLHRLVELNPIQVPRSMVREQKEVLIDDVHHRMESQGMKHEEFEQYREKWDKDFEKSAEFVISSSLLVNEIAKKENLFSTEDEFNQKLADYAVQSGIEIEKIRAYYDKPEARSRLRFQMTEDKVMEFLISKAKISEVPREKLPPEKN